MSEEALVRNCAPTLAGLKTGSLFVCAFDSRRQLARELRDANRILTPKGLRLVPLRCREGRVLLYLYRPVRLKADLSEAEAQALLQEAGYPVRGIGNYLAELARRLRSFNEFPHEIGLFLGYPPEDVKGFMVHKGKNSKCSGCWKVYGDADKAQRTFAAFRHCTDCYCKRHAMGATVEQLAVKGV